MQIEITTPGLLFPAISLLFLSYTNRYLTLAERIRQLHSDLQKQELQNAKGLLGQISNLEKRLHMIRWMQVFGAVSLLLSVISMGLLMMKMSEVGALLFFVALAFMTLSLILLIMETYISGGALKIMLHYASESCKEQK